ncbi:matrixin family metalloprotease [Streptomyces sp. NPDC001815]|uniref:matrixin family metalloprotease n=1 Tax=Streptomyces sp. NPDC001815 TaxID=3154526 RepID=UPI003324DA3D
MRSQTRHIGDGGMPGALSQAEAITAFKDAINNITMGYNDCGDSDSIDAGSTFMGPTTYESDISDDDRCTPRDGQSTWDAGNLAGYVAATCSWTTKRGDFYDLVEADVRYNTTDHNFTNNPTSSCTTQFDLRAVGTHEAGHVFGLGHAPDGHENLTMTPYSDTCDPAPRTLGRGDLLTLEYVY